MISSVFGKTKPINYIILLSFLFLFYWFANLYLFGRTFDTPGWILQTAVLGFLLFSLFAVNFVVKRNQITANNAYAILFFSLLVVLFPEVLLDNNAILAGFFLLLAFRRAISMRSLRNVRMKIFDASFWIAVSSIFYDWALLFLILVYVVLYMYDPKNLKNWLVPLISTATVALIAFTVMILTDNTAFLKEHYRFEIGMFQDTQAIWVHGQKLLGYGLLILFIGGYVFIKIGKLGLGRINVMRIIAVAFAISLGVTFLKTTASTFPVFLTFLPGAAILAKYVETIKRARFRELVLILSVLVPIMVLVIQHMAK